MHSQYVSAAATPPSQASAFQDTLTKISNDLAALRIKIDALEKSKHSSNKRSRSQSRDRNSEYCWIHAKFGKKARGCRGTTTRPCKWVDEQ